MGLFSTVATFIAISYRNFQQDPNVTTQSLALILQQLSSATSNGSSTNTASPSTQSSFVPPSSVGLVPQPRAQSHMRAYCHSFATMGPQVFQRNHAPHVRAHIREYFARGARRFGISELVELLPSLFLISLLLFFPRPVIFTSRRQLCRRIFHPRDRNILRLFPQADSPHSYLMTVLSYALLWFCTHEVPLSLHL